MSSGEWWRGRVRAARGRRGGDVLSGDDGDPRNKLERLYGAELEARRLAGELCWYRFGDVKLRLAQSCWYCIDYRVGLPGGRIEVHEVKGYWRDDARVKIKVAARLFPEFRFVAVRNIGSRSAPRWEFEEFPA